MPSNTPIRFHSESTVDAPLERLWAFYMFWWRYRIGRTADRGTVTGACGRPAAVDGHAGAAAAVAEIRRRLPGRIRLWLGGSGAGFIENIPVNVQVVDTLDRLERALRALRD